MITTSSGANLDFLRGLGADQTIDYTRQPCFEDQLRDIDVVLDAVGGDTVERSWRVLRRGGYMVSMAQPIPEPDFRQHNARGLFFGLFFIVEPNRDQLEEMAKLIDAGSLKTFVRAFFLWHEHAKPSNWASRAIPEARSCSRSETDT